MHVCLLSKIKLNFWKRQVNNKMMIRKLFKRHFRTLDNPFKQLLLNNLTKMLDLNSSIIFRMHFVKYVIKLTKPEQHVNVLTATFHFVLNVQKLIYQITD